MIDLGRLESLVDELPSTSLLVVGDVMLDEYLWGDVERISPEAPVPVVHVTDESIALGGAGNVVRNAVALGARCAFCGVVGNDAAGQRVAGLFKELGVDSDGLVVDDARPTTRKTRVVARSQQLVRFDRENESAVSGEAAKRLLESIRLCADRVQGAVFEDYAKGTLHAAVIEEAMGIFREKGVRVFVDPKSELEVYHGAELIKPNLREFEELTRTRIRDRRDLVAAAALLRERVGGSDLIVTRGAEGMTLFDDDAPEGFDVHTAAREVFDVQGAGDTVIAAIALARLAGASLLEAALIANAAAGVVLSKIGTAPARPDEVRSLLPQAIATAGVRE